MQTCQLRQRSLLQCQNVSISYLADTIAALVRNKYISSVSKMFSRHVSWRTIRRFSTIPGTKHIWAKGNQMFLNERLYPFQSRETSILWKYIDDIREIFFRSPGFHFNHFKLNASSGKWDSSFGRGGGVAK